MADALARQLAELDLLGQAALVRAGEVSAAELTEAAIARIEAVDPLLDAVVTPLFAQAREDVAGASCANGPLACAPYLVKDIGAPVRGVRSTLGSGWTADHVAAADGELVEVLRRAGLVIVGVTATTELAVAATSESRRFGPTRNPWATDRTAGGSSGGAAAAVASGMVPAAHANDASGSIRIPASCCGVFGLKPTAARAWASHDPRDPLAQLGDAFTIAPSTHAITRTVRDSAALLDATEALGGRGEGGFGAALERPLRPLRVALTTTTPAGERPHPECVAAAEETAALLERLGHDVVEDAPAIPVDELDDVLGTLESHGFARMLDLLEAALGPAREPLPPVVARFREEGRRIRPDALAAARAALVGIADDARTLWGRVDLWLTPTLGQPPLPLGVLDVWDEDVERFAALDRRFNPWCPIANWLRQPAASLPLHWSADGLPIGVQLTAAAGADALLLRTARALEEARPWIGRRPSVFATGNPRTPGRTEVSAVDDLGGVA